MSSQQSAEKSPSEWVKRLGRPEEAHVTRAHNALAAQLEDAQTRDEAALALLEEVRREDAKARKQALSLLQAFWWPPAETLAEDAVDSTLAGLSFVDAEEFQEVEDAVLLLVNLVRTVPSTLERVMGALGHPWHSVRWAAASTLGRVEVTADVLPELISLLTDDSADVQRAALESLGALAQLNPTLTAPLLLAEAVQREGAERYMALASLRGLLEGQHEGLGASSKQTSVMEKVADGQAVLALLEDEQAPIRLEAAALLGLLGGGDEATVAALRKPLRDKSPDVVATAAVSLLRLVPGDAQALGALSTLLCSPSEKDSGAALTSLDLLDAKTLRRAAPALELAFNKAAPETKREARALLMKASGKKA